MVLFKSLRIIKRRNKKNFVAMFLFQIGHVSTSFWPTEPVCISVISREFRPLAALYPPPPYKKVLYRSALSGRRGNMLMPTAFAPFYCISLKNIQGRGIMLPGVWFQGKLPAYQWNQYSVSIIDFSSIISHEQYFWEFFLLA